MAFDPSALRSIELYRKLFIQLKNILSDLEYWTLESVTSLRLGLLRCEFYRSFLRWTSEKKCSGRGTFSEWIDHSFAACHSHFDHDHSVRYRTIAFRDTQVRRLNDIKHSMNKSSQSFGGVTCLMGPRSLMPPDISERTPALTPVTQFFCVFGVGLFSLFVLCC